MIGILPAAGNAERMYSIPKFLLPIPGGGTLLHHIARQMKAALTKKIIMATRPGYMSIIAEMDINWIYTTQTKTMSETVLFLGNMIDHKEQILFGMPDTYFPDDDVYLRLSDLLQSHIAAVAVFKTRPEQRQKVGMVAIENGRLEGVIDKPLTVENMTLCWGAMAWNPIFWNYVKPEDPHVGYALERAIRSEENIGVYEAIGPYFDCGTPDEYFDCVAYTKRWTFA